MKKSIKLLLIAAAYLGVCYGIGQYRNSLKEDAATSQGNAESSEIENNEGNMTEAQTAETWGSISFEGVKKTTDTPWNFNAGTFDMEGEGECILLTPNTSVTICDIQGMDKFSFRYEIHPWVKDVSDGAGLLIWLLDAEDCIIYEDSIAVNSGGEWTEYELDLSGYRGAEKIKIQCNNGGNDDDAGDWVVVKKNNSIIETQTNIRQGEKKFCLAWSDKPFNSNINYKIIDDNMQEPVLVQGEIGDSLDVLNPSVIFFNNIYYNYYLKLPTRNQDIKPV